MTSDSSPPPLPMLLGHLDVGRTQRDQGVLLHIDLEKAIIVVQTLGRSRCCWRASGGLAEEGDWSSIAQTRGEDVLYSSGSARAGELDRFACPYLH